MPMTESVTVLSLVAVLAAVIVWVDSRLLRDLAATTDRQLQHLDRRVWGLTIVLAFPVGPKLYLRFGKGPGPRQHCDLALIGNAGGERPHGLASSARWPGRRRQARSS